MHMLFRRFSLFYERAALFSRCAGDCCGPRHSEVLQTGTERSPLHGRGRVAHARTRGWWCGRGVQDVAGRVCAGPVRVGAGIQGLVGAATAGIDGLVCGATVVGSRALTRVDVGIR